MAEFEGQSLHVVRLQAIVVIDDVIVGGTNSPLVSSLADQVEVIPAEKQGSGEKGSQSRVKLKQSTMRACKRSVWGLGGSLESQALAVCASLTP